MNFHIGPSFIKKGEGVSKVELSLYIMSTISLTEIRILITQTLISDGGTVIGVVLDPKNYLIDSGCF